jgi:hypothetical protein
VPRPGASGEPCERARSLIFDDVQRDPGMGTARLIPMSFDAADVVDSTEVEWDFGAERRAGALAQDRNGLLLQLRCHVLVLEAVPIAIGGRRESGALVHRLLIGGRLRCTFAGRAAPGRREQRASDEGMGARKTCRPSSQRSYPREYCSPSVLTVSFSDVWAGTAREHSAWPHPQTCSPASAAQTSEQYLAP